MTLEEHLRSYNLLSEEDISHFKQAAKLKPLKKGDFLIQQGDVCHEIAFINTGILRSYYYDQSGEEVTYCLTFPGSFGAAYSSYISQRPSDVQIQALNDSEVFVITKKEFDQLADNNLQWMKFQKQIAERYFMTLEQRVFEHQRENADTRYARLIATRPQYIQQIPLQHIASYLGITLRHLSRIRSGSLIRQMS